MITLLKQMKKCLSSTKLYHIQLHKLEGVVEMEENRVEKTESNASLNEIQGNIINVDQKLRGLRAEIEAKLQSSALYQGADKEEYIERLSHLEEEITQMLSGIDILVKIMASDNEELKEIFFQTEDMQQLNNVLNENLVKITKIRQVF